MCSSYNTIIYYKLLMACQFPKGIVITTIQSQSYVNLGAITSVVTQLLRKRSTIFRKTQSACLRSGTLHTLKNIHA